MRAQFRPLFVPGFEIEMKSNVPFGGVTGSRVKCFVRSPRFPVPDASFPYCVRRDRQRGGVGEPRPALDYHSQRNYEVCSFKAKGKVS